MNVKSWAGTEPSFYGTSFPCLHIADLHKLMKIVFNVHVSESLHGMASPA